MIVLVKDLLQRWIGRRILLSFFQEVEGSKRLPARKKVRNLRNCLFTSPAPVRKVMVKPKTARRDEEKNDRGANKDCAGFTLLLLLQFQRPSTD
jgi:hypothetical protein